MAGHIHIVCAIIKTQARLRVVEDPAYYGTPTRPTTPAPETILAT